MAEPSSRDPLRRILDAQAALRGLADLIDHSPRASVEPSDLAVIIRLAEREIDAGLHQLAANDPEGAFCR